MSLQSKDCVSYISILAQVVKNLPSPLEDPGSISGSGGCPGEGHSYPLQYSCLENPVDRGACQATVHGAAEGLKATEPLKLVTFNEENKHKETLTP